MFVNTCYIFVLIELTEGSSIRIFTIRVCGLVIITARQWSCGKVMFSLVCVCSQGLDIPGPRSFPGVTTPGPRSLLGWVCPSEWVPRGWVLNPQLLMYSWQGSSTHPTGMLACYLSCVCLCVCSGYNLWTMALFSSYLSTFHDNLAK